MTIEGFFIWGAIYTPGNHQALSGVHSKMQYRPTNLDTQGWVLSSVDDQN